MPATMTDGGFPIRCEICGESSFVDVSRPPGDSVCPVCGTFLWVDALVEFAAPSGFVPDVRIPELIVLADVEAISRIVAALGAEFDWTEEQTKQLGLAIFKRERLGTTGIGLGIALPHAKVDWIDRCFTALAYLPLAIDFNTVDGRPVHTIALIACPKHRPAEGLLAIERIARSLYGVGSR